MLIQLKIQNLILVDLAEISFTKGLNIITGETGSGKSAILAAIELIAGVRADCQLVGKSGDLAIVEALISNYTPHEEIPSPPQGEPLFIRREIHKNGKSRTFIQDHFVSLSLLRQMVGTSIELIDQSSSHMLSSQDLQRNLLDAFAETLEEAKELELSFSKQNQMESALHHLTLASETRSRDLEWAEEDLSLIEEIRWEEGEDEKLKSEHELLTKSQEILSDIEEAIAILSEHPLKKSLHLIERSSRIDPHLCPIANQIKSTFLEIEDAEKSLSSYLNRLETDPLKLKAIEDRIANIEQIKRRFGKTFGLVEEKKKELQQRIDELSHLEERKKQIEKALYEMKANNETLAKNLSEKRKRAAFHLSSLILKELQSLNLPSAQFHISLTQTALKPHGSDSIEFLFSANAGHGPLPLQDCASGGELSRLLFAFKTILAEKENSQCLVFDEIDSNVGGNTASILGEKLKKIAEEKQVICVTHFVQVAKCATTHFAVDKQEKDNRSFTKIARLSALEKLEEYQRMLGT